MLMTPEAFCAAVRTQLAQSLRDEAWARGATGLCEMYASATSERFQVILEQTAQGSPASALAEVARWLLPRWRASSKSGP
jgi:hypothetical protein